MYVIMKKMCPSGDFLATHALGPELSVQNVPELTVVNRISCVQVHELSQSRHNREGTLFS